MSLEKFANNATTTLNGAISSGASSLVVSSATAFPTTPQFRILIDSEILLVTGVSGTTFTVLRGQEDTVAAAHNNGATVEHVLSRDALLTKDWFDPRAFGAVGDNVADDRAAIQAALDAADDVNGTVYLPAGIWRITTGPLYVPSGVTIRGESERTTRINQQTSGQPVLVSKAYKTTYGVEPGGMTTIRDLYLTASGASGAHGIILHDYYSRIENVEIESCDRGIFITELDDAAGTVAGTMVENRVKSVIVRSCVGYGVYIGEDDNGKLTDGVLSDVIVSGTTATSGIHIGSGAGWQLNNIHTYGSFTGPALRIRAAYHTVVDGFYGESGYTTDQILFSAFQRAATVSNVTVIMNSGGGNAIRVDKSALYAGDGITVNGMTIVQDNAAAVTALNSSATTARINAAGIARQGSQNTQISMTGGAGASAIYVSDWLGWHGYAEATADQTGVTSTETDLTSLSVTVTVLPNRRIRVSGEAMLASTVAGDTADLYINDNGSRIQLRRVTLAVANAHQSVHASRILTPAAGSHTFKLSFVRASGTGSIANSASSTHPSYILVEDLGPA